MGAEPLKEKIKDAVEKKKKEIGKGDATGEEKAEAEKEEGGGESLVGATPQEKKALKLAEPLKEKLKDAVEKKKKEAAGKGDATGEEKAEAGKEEGGGDSLVGATPQEKKALKLAEPLKEKIK